MKRVLYIHQYFRTPQEGGAIRSYFIATALVQRGFRVELITAYHAKCEVKEIEGVRVHYLPVHYSNDMRPLRRYWAFLKFVYYAIHLSAKLPKPDLAYVSSTPLTVGIIGLWLRRFRSIPYFFEVRDLWPTAPIQLGIMRSKVMRRLAESLEKASYKNAEHLVALSPGIRDGILSRVENAHVSVIPNMADVDFFEQKAPTIHDQWPFEIGYFGAMGMANGLQYIVDIAEACQSLDLSVRFTLMGEGSEKQKLADAIQQKKLRNISLLPPADRQFTRQKMWEADACLVSFLKFPVMETCSPNKFFDALAAGKLCLVNTNGWLRELVEDNACGLYFDPEDPESFPSLIEPFIRDRERLRKYQKNAMLLAKSHFSRKQLEAQVCELIAECCSKNQ